EKQRLQAELAHVARTNAMGQLSSALAHELNQPLTASMNYVNAARQWLSTGANADKVPPLLAKAVEQTVRAGQIIQRLRSFLEKREPARAPENLNTVVREAVALGAVGMVDDDIVLKLDLAAHLPEVMADRVQIQQVVVNLIRNAGEAMHGRPLRKLTVRTWRGPEDGACVSIADTGPGLAEEVAARLFEPFVSTKQTGMGVGLSICRTILEAHEGRIWMTPTPGGGATFHFQLPPRIVS
ncbi:MAG: sensor histidine kinase, partial [Rhizomicrobium sp.]